MAAPIMTGSMTQQANHARPVVRRAVPDDLDMFMVLTTEYLHELRSLGSEVLPTQRTLEFWMELFERYSQEDESGVVVFAGDFGFSAAGNFGNSSMDTIFGECAYGYGTYVRPDHRRKGLSERMRTMVNDVLYEKGFKTIIGGVHFGNTAGLESARKNGFVPFQIIGHVPITPPKEISKWP